MWSFICLERSTLEWIFGIPTTMMNKPPSSQKIIVLKPDPWNDIPTKRKLIVCTPTYDKLLWWFCKIFIAKVQLYTSIHNDKFWYVYFTPLLISLVFILSVNKSYHYHLRSGKSNELNFTNSKPSFKIFYYEVYFAGSKIV